jgi:hypothetical protein
MRKTLVAVVLILLTRSIEMPVAKRTISGVTQYVFLPFVGVSKPPGLHGQGVASVASGQFNNLLKASWFYVWNWCSSSGCVPMTRNWAMPPSCPPILMLGNEPNSIEPYGFPISPETAAMVSLQIKTQCPNTWFVSGNVALPQFLGISSIEWLQRYFNASGIADQIGIHNYIAPGWTAEQAIQVLDSTISAFPGKKFCITEFGDYNRNPEIFRAYLSAMKSRVDCFASFTDRDPNWYIYGTNLNMVNDDGTLNIFGQIYAGQ